MNYIGMCTFGGSNSTALVSDLLPLIGISTLTTAFIIALGYLFGELTQNPKIILWAKTEFLQLFISLGAVLVIISSITSLCSIYVDDIGSVFGVSVSDHLNLFDGAQFYFIKAAEYIHAGLAATRYHLGGYNLLEMYGRWLCSSEIEAINVLMCLFGNSIGFGAGSGISLSPLAGYGIAGSGMHLAFSSLVFAYLSVLNYLMILRYIYSGLVFFMLPVGIFLRSMPFLRTLGALLISLVFAFAIVYPLVLSLFYLDLASTSSVLAPEQGDVWDAVNNYKDRDLNDVTGFWDLFDIDISNDVFPKGTKEFQLAQFTGHAILIGVFIPSLAMLAAIASLVYISRFLGEEIDLSRIVQMV